MAKLGDLSTMKDEEYKLLTPKQLMEYNKSLPKIDYDDPYIHKPYPKMLFRLVENADGTGSIQTTIVEDAAAHAKLPVGEWKNSPSDFGIETAPGAAVQPVETYSIPVPSRGALDLAKEEKKQEPAKKAA
jgi:hypothetical protein